MHSFRFTVRSDRASVAFNLPLLPDGGADHLEYTFVDADEEGVPAATLDFILINAEPVTVVEYATGSPARYFMTADAAEIAALDDGLTPGWTRTGEHFRAYPPGLMPSNAGPVCRYYVRPVEGVDSHFFSSDAAECAAVATLWPDQLVLETGNAFGVATEYPLTSIYACDDDAYQQVYRLYKPDSTQHRYVTSNAVVANMLAQGWVTESAMCAIK